MIHVRQHRILYRLLQTLQVEHIPGLRIDFTPQRDLQPVVVAVAARVVAEPVDLLILPLRERRVMKTVSGAEVQPSGDSRDWHW